MNETMKNTAAEENAAAPAQVSAAAAEAACGAEPLEPFTDEELAPWEEMLLAYPDADAPEKLPKGVAEAIAGGKTPLVAMHEAEIARLRAVIAAYEQKEKAQKSCGSALGTAAPASDPVLEILLGE